MNEENTTVEDVVDETTETTEQEEDPRAVPKYSDNDLDRIIEKKLARERQKEAKKREKEEKDAKQAELLSRRTAEEKSAATIKDLQDRISKFEREALVNSMMSSARTRFQERGLVIPDEIITNLITDDADTTAENIDVFAELVEKLVDDRVTERMKRKTPKRTASTVASSRGKSKEQILSITDPYERVKAIKENPDLFPDYK